MGVLDEADVERCRTDIEGGGLLEGVQFVVGVPRHVVQVVRQMESGEGEGVSLPIERRGSWKDAICGCASRGFQQGD